MCLYKFSSSNFNCVFFDLVFGNNKSRILPFKVLAQRCREAGLTEMICTIDAVPNSKTEKFLQTLEADGVALKEQERFIAPRPWHEKRQEKPWEDENL